MSDNILINMLKRVSEADGLLDWEAPKDRQQWMDESSLLIACEEGEKPLLRLSDTVVTMVDSGEPLGLLKQAKVKLLHAGREIILRYGN
jgi:hypothetical protein